MCGIAGLVARDGLDHDAQSRVIVMRDVLVHRGPDAAGVWSDRHAALGHRRLSIVDLAGGSQPLANEDESVWIVYNGEVYNHAELRRELESAGHQYRTRSDTESIVHAYEQWGDDCVHHLRGMFAFAIWDARRRRLLLARDRLGVKPLYWAEAGDRLLFGSEIKALLASGLVQARAREEGVAELLAARGLAGEDTLFTGVRKLLPGHRLVFEEGRIRVEQYWDIPVASATPASPDSRSWVDRFRTLLEESVRLRLMADVPLGMFLSGGLDSSAIAAIMARQIDRPLQTFSVAFAERAYSELAWSREVAAAIGAVPHEVVIGPHDFFGALPRLLWHEDEPLAHPSSVPLHFVSRLAREHVTVVLTGEGSDELLAGYGRYPRALFNWRAGRLYERVVPGVVRETTRARLLPHLPGKLGRYAQRSFLATGGSPAAVFFDNFGGVRADERLRLLSGDLRNSARPDAAWDATLAHFNRHPGAAPLDRLLYADLKTYLVELLMKQDQMSMSASVESRVPFLDHRLVEFAATMPASWKLQGLTTKRVLRDAVRDLLPASILSRPKMGFPVPFGIWLRHEWHDVARDVLLDPRTRQRGIVDPAAVRQVLDEHRAGTRDAGDTIWALLNLELWYRTWIDGGGVQVLAAPARAGIAAAPADGLTTTRAEAPGLARSA